MYLKSILTLISSEVNAGVRGGGDLEIRLISRMLEVVSDKYINSDVVSGASLVEESSPLSWHINMTLFLVGRSCI